MARRAGAPAEIAIRSEGGGDAAKIAALVQRAYAAIPYSDHREHLMIARLRSGAGFVRALSLLAEVDGAAAGHILLTRARIGTAPTLALAPLSVVPEHQGRGIGRRLVRAAHERAARLGFGSIVVVGLPDYYPQFGYEPLGRYPITLPFEAPPANRMILPLAPGALEDVAGRVVYAEGWLDH